jgi:hypothetical protein
MRFIASTDDSATQLAASSSIASRIVDATDPARSGGGHRGRGQHRRWRLGIPRRRNKRVGARRRVALHEGHGATPKQAVRSRSRRGG